MTIKNNITTDILSGLDLKNFDIIQVMTRKHYHPVVLMRDKRPEAMSHWCLQYKGAGRYFETLKDVKLYCAKRNWGNPLNG